MGDDSSGDENEVHIRKVDQRGRVGLSMYRMMVEGVRRGRGCLLLLALMCLLASSAWSQDAYSEMFKSSTAPLQISADEMQFDHRSGQYIASGNVVVTRDQFRLSADILRYDQQRKTLHAVGNVSVETEDDRLSGSEVFLDLEQESGSMTDGLLYLHEPGLVISAKKLEKVGADTYLAEHIGITACEGESPDWRITGQRLKLTIEGYAIIWHSAFYIKKIPVLYTPFFIFPVKQQRQTGLLPPRMGHSSRMGAYLDLPFYWAIDDHSDATLYAHYLEKRGLKSGLEYRYRLSPQSQGALLLDYLRDDKIDDGATNWGYDDDLWQRTNRDRYWFRMKHDQALPAGLTALVDVDVVSDQDFLMEFSSGHSGFEASRTYFDQTFTREIDDKEATVRTNRLNIGGVYGLYALNAGMKWYDDIIDRKWEEQGDTLNQWPYLRINGARQPVFNTPVLFASDLAVERLYSQKEDRWNRIAFAPNLIWPLKWKDYATIESLIGVEERLWFPERTVNEETTWEHRQVYRFSVNAGTVLHHDYQLASPGLEGLTHTVQPELIYEYISVADDKEYPEIDISDRAADGRRVKMVVENALRFREGAQDQSSLWAKTMLRLKASQGVDLKERHEPGTGWSGRLSPLSLEFETAVADNVFFIGDVDWSHESGSLLSGNLWLRLQTQRGDHLLTSYRYTENLSETLSVDLNLTLSQRLSVKCGYEASIADDHEIRRSLGLVYHAGCWSVDIVYVKEEEEQKYEFGVTLKALGGISTSK